MLSKKEIEIIFKRLYLRLSLFAFTYLKDSSLSEDIVSNVFTKILESNQISLKTQGQIDGYFFTAVKNRCFDHLKNKKIKATKAYPIEILEKLQEDRFFIKEAVTLDVTKILYNAIDSLPNKCGQVVKLVLKEKTDLDIANQLSISVRTVQKHKENANKRLRELILKLQAE